MDKDISSDSSSSDKDTAIGAYWDSNVGLPFRLCVRRGILDLELFFIDISIIFECCRYTFGKYGLFTRETRVF